MMILPLVVLAVPGVIVGVIITSVATSYSADRRFWPWSCRRGCNHDAPPLRLLACARTFIRPRHARDNDAPTSHTLWLGIVTAAVFCGLEVRYGTEPLLLLVSLGEAALLLLLLVIDLDQHLIPTPVIGVLVAMALVSADLRPGLDLRDALIGGAIGFASFAALGGLARLFCGADAFGLGDAMLALVVGCITGYPLVVATLALGVILGGVGALVVLLTKRGGLRSVVPYGPYVISGLLVILIQGDTTMHLWIPW